MDFLNIIREKIFYIQNTFANSKIIQIPLKYLLHWVGQLKRKLLEQVGKLMLSTENVGKTTLDNTSTADEQQTTCGNWKKTTLAF